MTNLWQSFDAALSGGGFAALPLALAGGVVMGLNPCCLALYPAVAATCCAVDRGALAARSALAFVAGTAAATTLLGILAALAGHAVLGLGAWPHYAVALVLLLLGAHLLGFLRVPFPAAVTARRGSGLAAAFVSGVSLSLVLGSCGTPVLASILSYAAYQGNPPFGAALLFLYGLGSGLPLLLVGAGAGELAQRMGRSEWRRAAERLAGAVVLGSGFYLIVTAP